MLMTNLKQSNINISEDLKAQYLRTFYNMFVNRAK